MIWALPIRILAASLALIAALVGLVLHEGRARASGTEAILPMEALDPKSPLTGHYAALRLTQRLPQGQACPARNQAYQEGGWIGLRPVEGRQVFVAAGPTREAVIGAGAALAVRGGFYCSGRAFGDDRINAVTLELGVDRFHAQEDEARAMETALNVGRPGQDGPPGFAIISVGKDGRARLKGVMIGERRVELTWW